jgi:predicted esterase
MKSTTRHFTCSAILAASFASAAAEVAMPLESWFGVAIKGNAAPLEDSSIPVSDIEKRRAQAFSAYKEAATKAGWGKTILEPFQLSQKGGQIKLQRGEYHIGEGLDMPYVVLRKGERPENGWPLVIAMHGGGGTGDKLENPHAWPVNTREWQAQIKLSISQYPDDATYFVPRMVDDNQGRWWKEFNHTAFTAMIRHAILFWDVDPNRVYMLGISEGGYGTEALACRYPDRLAAANGMACGSGTSIHVENLRNLPFRTDTGENDTMFGRIANAVAKHKLLELLRKTDPGGYVNHLEIHKGRGHGIDYRPGPEWMVKHTRNPHPDRVTVTLFQHDKVKNKGAYWLQATNDLDKKVIRLDGIINRMTNTIDITANATINDEVVQAADWQKPLADSGETAPASGLKLRIWLHESLVDLSKPVKININGKEAGNATPKPQLSTLCESLMEFGDPEFSYPASVDVVVP